MNSAHLVLIAVLIVVACEEDRKPPVPTTPTPNTTILFPGPSLSRLNIQGPAPTVGPRQTAAVKAVALFSDGSERDVTADARWTSTQPEIATVDGGVITGQALGRTLIRATYMSRSASLAMVIKPEGTFILQGTITEPGPVNVGTATVAVLSGPSQQQVTADSFGFYELIGVTGMLTLRVSKPGYRDETTTLTVTRDQNLDVQIRPIAAPASVAGVYGVTLTVSPSCSLVPNDQRTRTYTATVGQDIARLNIQLGDANFVVDDSGRKNSFNGTVFGSTVTFNWGSGDYYYYYYGTSQVQETLPDGQILGIWGKLVVTAAQTMTGDLVGGFSFREGNRTRRCSAADSRVVFTRR